MAREKYYVIAMRYDDENNLVMREIMGVFDRFIYAVGFRDWYNKNYHANAVIKEEQEILSKL